MEEPAGRKSRGRPVCRRLHLVRRRRILGMPRPGKQKAQSRYRAPARHTGGDSVSVDPLCARPVSGTVRSLCVNVANGHFLWTIRTRQKWDIARSSQTQLYLVPDRLLGTFGR